MKYSVTGPQMKKIDQDAINRVGIPSLVLMERAALAVADEANAQASKRGRAAKGGKRPARIAAVCGTGNNGADGIAAGRILWGMGYEVAIFLAGDPDHATGERQLQEQIARRLGILVEEATKASFAAYDVVIDALLGIGLERMVEGEYKRLIVDLAAQREAAIVAVDVPSGIHGETGAVMGAALPAAATVTFGYVKSGLLLYPGRAYAGQVHVADIGFPACSLQQAGWDAKVLEPSDLACLPRRRADGHKGTFGKLLVVAGSAGMGGAAYLSALAAYRTGVGLVRILTVSENRPMLQTLLPEAIVDVLEVGPDGEWLPKAQREVKSLCGWADAVVMGPGLGQGPYVEKLVEEVLSCPCVPMVLDADALNVLADHPRLLGYLEGNRILTPHMGEMARLAGQPVGELKANALKAARGYASATGAVCVLKDASTAIADPSGAGYINTSGCSAMAKAGSGDVLAGVLGGMLLQGLEGIEAAAYGVYLHGLAGEAAAARLGDQGVLARDIANAIPFTTILGNGAEKHE